MNNGRRLKILLTEGSSLSARQTIYALTQSTSPPGGEGKGLQGAIIDVCDARPLLSLARSSWHVRSCYRCPSFARHPDGYLRFLEQRLRSFRYDVLLGVHDQVYLLSRHRDRLSRLVGLAVPEFEALQRLQSKAGFIRLLAALGLPHPHTLIVRRRSELDEFKTPCYLKLAHSTAGQGVWYVQDAAEAAARLTELERQGLLSGDSELLVQQPARGCLCVVQSVFQHGRLVAAHCYRARALGLGGSARCRISVSHPQVLDHLGRLGGHLKWHGALMFDYFFDDATQQPEYIEANPRIGETMNATLSGVNLCELLVRVSLGESVPSGPTSRAGVQTHSVLTSLLAAAEEGASRRRLLRELGSACLHRGLYAASEDELTRLADDPPSVLPALYVTCQLLIDPAVARRIVRRTVENYALSAEAADKIQG